MFLLRLLSTTRMNVSDIFCGSDIFGAAPKSTPSSPKGPRKVSRNSGSKSNGDWFNDLLSEIVPVDEEAKKQEKNEKIRADMEREAAERKLKYEEAKAKEDERLRQLKAHLAEQEALRKREEEATKVKKSGSFFSLPLSRSGSVSVGTPGALDRAKALVNGAPAAPVTASPVASSPSSAVPPPPTSPPVKQSSFSFFSSTPKPESPKPLKKQRSKKKDELEEGADGTPSSPKPKKKDKTSESPSPAKRKSLEEEKTADPAVESPAPLKKQPSLKKEPILPGW